MVIVRARVDVALGFKYMSTVICTLPPAGYQLKVDTFDRVSFNPAILFDASSVLF